MSETQQSRVLGRWAGVLLAFAAIACAAEVVDDPQASSEPSTASGGSGGSGTGATGGTGTVGTGGIGTGGGGWGGTGSGSSDAGAAATGGAAGAGVGGTGGVGGTTATGGTGGCVFPFPCATGGTSGTGGTGTGGVGGGATTDGGLPGFSPSPNNAAECPKEAPANPVGSCLGLPIYLSCSYSDGTRTYSCVCDWYHWLCV